MEIKNKNILQTLVVILFLGLFIGVAIKDKGTSEEVQNTNTQQLRTVDEQSLEVEESIEEPVSNYNINEQTVSGNSIADNNVIYKQEEDNNYVVYILARVINPKDTSEDQKFRCVINKNEEEAETGLIDIIIDSNTLPLLSEDSDINIEEYKADIKVNNAGEWLYVGNYYEIMFDEITLLESGAKEVRLKAVGPADENAVNSWKQGRALNSTFLNDMDIIKQSEPAEIYPEICYTYQYTWTFEQIEAFKAYVESLNDEAKSKWMKAASELDLSLGY